MEPVKNHYGLTGWLSLSLSPSFSNRVRVGQEEQRGGKEMTNRENYFAVCGTRVCESFKEEKKGGIFLSACWGLRSKLSLLENNHTAWQIYITFHITFHIPAPAGIRFHCTGSRPLPSTTSNQRPMLGLTKPSAHHLQPVVSKLFYQTPLVLSDELKHL